MAKQCVIGGCQKLQAGRGYCYGHYERWLKYGDPTAGGTPKGALKRFIEGALRQETDACIIWPFHKCKKGYARMKTKGATLAHRIVCERANGPAPSVNLDAAHTCGNPSCVNPKHLRWATPKENAADKYVHGTQLFGSSHPQAKLTDDQVKYIREAKDESQRQIARRFGVSQQLISNIRLGKSRRAA